MPSKFQSYIDQLKSHCCGYAYYRQCISAAAL